MGNFTYSREFKDSASIVLEFGGDKYCVFVHDFCGEDSFSVDDFESYEDATRALVLVSRILHLVDRNLAQGLKLADVRDEALDAARKVFDYYIAHGA